MTRSKWCHPVPDWGAKALLLSFSLAIASMQGCTETSSKESAQKVPGLQGEVLFRIGNKSIRDVSLKREGVQVSFHGAEGFPFGVGDTVRNQAPDSLLLSSGDPAIMLQLRTGSSIQLERRSLILQVGSTRMEFRKLNEEFRVRVPSATLGIRGTTLEVNVDPTGASLVRLLEGHIIMYANGGGETPMKEGETALLPADGSAPKMNLEDIRIREFMENLSPEALQKAIQKL